MMRNLSLAMLALAGLLCFHETGWGQIVIQRPRVRVVIGGGAGLQVCGPFGRLCLPGLRLVPRCLSVPAMPKAAVAARR